MGGKVMGKRDRKYVGGGIGLLGAAAGLQVLARGMDGVADWYARGVYPVIVGTLGRFFGIFPFSVVEMGIYLLGLGVIVYGVVFWREPARVGSRAVFVVGVLLFLYTCNCGVNYYASSFADYAGLEIRMYSEEELRRLCEFLAERVNETAVGETYREHKGEWRREGVLAMQKAGEAFPVLGGFYPEPKEVTAAWILSVQQLCGIYSPFTVEANFNGDMPDYNIPHTMCHELSHLKGFMREDEANFIGYLACISSEKQAFQYSGYLTGWVYAGNALAQVDRESYIEIYGRLCGQAQEDLKENNAFWEQYEGKVAEAANQINDVYLKVNDQKDGVKSYGRMVDLMLEYYKNRN